MEETPFIAASDSRLVVFYLVPTAKLSEIPSNDGLEKNFSVKRKDGMPASGTMTMDLMGMKISETAPKVTAQYLSSGGGPKDFWHFVVIIPVRANATDLSIVYKGDTVAVVAGSEKS
jgi:hypothetical protein